MLLIGTYELDIPMQVSADKPQGLNKAAQNFIANQESVDEACNLHVDSAIWTEIEEHNAALVQRTKPVIAQVISPMVTLTWLYMLSKWRNLLDFDFDRPVNFDGDTPIERFNDTNYLQKHQIWDWHSFALLKDNVLIHNGLIIRHGGDELLFVIDVEYHIPYALQNAMTQWCFVNQ